MALNYTLPLGKDDSVKNLVFTILTREYPLKLIELMNLIKKRYGKSVTFQAVRKAVLELKTAGIIAQEGKEFRIDRQWVLESKRFIDRLSQDLLSEKHHRNSKPAVDAIGQEVSVFTFNSLNELMQFWEQIIEDWYHNINKDDLKINCWQGAHGWEALLHPDAERQIMGKLAKKGVVSYMLNTSNTLLDRSVVQFYTAVGLKTVILSANSSFDKEYYFGTYGRTIVQVHYPKKIVEELDAYFAKTKTLEQLDLTELSDIVNQKIQVKMSVIKSEAMAKQMNQSILIQFPKKLPQKR